MEGHSVQFAYTTLDEVLCTPQRVCLFREFCSQHYAEVRFAFFTADSTGECGLRCLCERIWIHCEEAFLVWPQASVLTFREIWNRFIGTTATQPVNLPIDIVRTLKTAMDNPSMLMFAPAKNNINRLMEADLLWKYNKWLIQSGKRG